MTANRRLESAAAASAELRHLPSLDGVRGLAIGLVLLHNMTVLEGPIGAVGRGVALATDLGWIGVQLFFVLSGFLITRILLQTQGSAHYYRSFYARRVLRIFPLYYATLLFFFVLLPWLNALPPGFELDRAHQAWYWLYLSNWSATLAGEGTGLPHFWSLAVEEQFYLLWPFLVHRRSPAQVLRLCLGVALLSLVARAGLLAAAVSPEMVYRLSPCRMDAIALGGAAAALMHMPQARASVMDRHRAMWASAAALFIGGVLLTQGLYARTSMLDQTLGYSVLSLVFMLGILAAVAGDHGTNPAGSFGMAAMLRWAPLRTLGKYSYGIYILHKPLHDLVARPWLAQRGWSPTASVWVGVTYLAVAMGVCLMIAMLSYHGFEKRFLDLKGRFVA